MTKTEKASQRANAVENLKAYVKPGDTVYTILKKVSSSGMTRHIEVVIPYIGDDGKPSIRNITYWVGEVLDYRVKNDALVVGGVGMDMGFHVVYGLASVLYKDTFACIGEDCRSNDHTNDRNGEWERSKNKGRIHSDGGYSLNQRWI